MNVDLDWSLTWDDFTWTAGDLIGEEVGNLVMLLGDEWTALSPTASPIALTSHIAVHVAHDRGVPLEVVVDEVKAAPLPKLIAALLSPSQVVAAVPTDGR